MTVYAASLKAPQINTGPSGTSMPWVDPWILIQATNAGVAAKMTHGELEKSRGAMGLGNKI